MADGRATELGVRSIWLVVLGAVLVLFAFRFLTWYDVPQSGGADIVGDINFGALRSSAQQLGDAGVALAYFQWLSWAALIAVILLGVGAAIPTPASAALRVAGFAAGLVGLLATWYALRQHLNATGSRHDVFYNSTWGVWLTFAGFLLAATGAVLGPEREQ